VGLQPRPAHVGQGPLGLGLALCAYMYPGGSPSIINPIQSLTLLQQEALFNRLVLCLFQMQQRNYLACAFRIVSIHIS
jgi:hypothetical protein